MLNKEEFENAISEIKNSLDETESAKISDKFLGILSTYNSALENIAELEQDKSKLKNDNEELLKVNGKLFQQIGFKKEPENPSLPKENQNKDEWSIDKLIDSKGDFI